MSTYLVKTTEEYRCDTEAEAAALINEAKFSSDFSLVKYSTCDKTTKAKGEIIDEWKHVVLVKAFTSEKEPTEQTTITYTVEDVFEVDE